jgi:hypothetical protein
VLKRGKHPLLTGHTRYVPLVEIGYTGLPVVKASIETTVLQGYETSHSDNMHYGPVIHVICNCKQCHYSDHRIYKMMKKVDIPYRYM